MINNFEAIRDLLTFGDEDKFYLIQIFKRRKDNPEMKKDMVIIDNYFVYYFIDNYFVNYFNYNNNHFAAKA